MKIMVNNLWEEKLNYAVALADGWVSAAPECPVMVKRINKRGVMEYTHPFNYSTNWAHGGPIVEKTFMKIEFYPTIGWRAAIEFLDEPQAEIVGAPTPLIAAMRCFVASKLGDEADIPDKVITQSEAVQKYREAKNGGQS